MKLYRILDKSRPWTFTPLARLGPPLTYTESYKEQLPMSPEQTEQVVQDVDPVVYAVWEREYYGDPACVALTKERAEELRRELCLREDGCVEHGIGKGAAYWMGTPEANEPCSWRVLEIPLGRLPEEGKFPAAPWKFES